MRRHAVLDEQCLYICISVVITSTDGTLVEIDVTFPFIKSFERAAVTTDIPHRRPLVLLGEGDALSELHKSLGAAMEGNGLRAAAHFTPHMTLHYGSKPISLEAIKPIRFAVQDFARVHSERWLTGYNIVDRWPLALEG